MSKRGTSMVPLVLSIIGAVIGIPAAACGGACVAGISAFADASNTTEIGQFYLWFGIVGAALGLIFGILSKRIPVSSGIMLIIAALISGFTMITGNMLALVVAVLFLIAGAISIAQKKVEA